MLRDIPRRLEDPHRLRVPKGLCAESSVKIGYARVSTEEQSLGLQRDALLDAKVARGFVELASGASKNRPGVDALLEMLRAKAERRRIFPLSRSTR